MPGCLVMRDGSLELIMEHVGGDRIPDNAPGYNAVGKGPHMDSRLRGDDTGNGDAVRKKLDSCN